MKLLTTSEIAERYVHKSELRERLGVSPKAFNKMMKCGRIPAPDIHPTSITMLWRAQTLEDAGIDLASLGFDVAPRAVDPTARPDPFIAANEPYRIFKSPPKPAKNHRRRPPRLTDSDPRPTALYRHFDEDGRLLYVGISLSPLARLQEHLGCSAWTRSIATVTVEWHETRQSAGDAEMAAIQAERPMHNIIGMPEDDQPC